VQYLFSGILLDPLGPPSKFKHHGSKNNFPVKLKTFPNDMEKCLANPEKIPAQGFDSSAQPVQQRSRSLPPAAASFSVRLLCRFICRSSHAESF
jgi:hypothetical protein